MYFIVLQRNPKIKQNQWALINKKKAQTKIQRQQKNNIKNKIKKQKTNKHKNKEKQKKN